MFKRNPLLVPDLKLIYFLTVKADTGYFFKKKKKKLQVFQVSAVSGNPVIMAAVEGRSDIIWSLL